MTSMLTTIAEAQVRIGPFGPKKQYVLPYACGHSEAYFSGEPAGVRSKREVNGRLHRPAVFPPDQLVAPVDRRSYDFRQDGCRPEGIEKTLSGNAQRIPVLST
jgi:hypothetical protein